MEQNGSGNINLITGGFGVQYRRVIKYSTTRKNTQRYYTPKCQISYLFSNCFFSAECFCSFLIRREKQSGQRRVARSRLVKQAFLQHKITNCLNNRTISQDICTRFVRYLYSTYYFSAKCFCSFLIRREKQSGQRSITRAADWLNRLFYSIK